MDYLWLVVLVTAIWVYSDARSIGVKKGQLKGFADLGPAGWFIATLLLWIVAFPLYLAKRGTLKRINGRL
jgi:hypothetical protein